MNTIHYEELRENDLVTWHDQSGERSLPIPGVVVRQEGADVIIKARVQSAIREVQVDPNHLTIR